MEGTCRKDNLDEGTIRALIFSYYDRVEVLESKFSNSVSDPDNKGLCMDRGG